MMIYNRFSLLQLDKKIQKETIDNIVQYFDEYRIYLERILKKG